MFCPECGSPVAENAKFCENCGVRVRTDTEKAGKAPAFSETARSREEAPAEAVTAGGSGNIRLCPDGSYRWIYEFSMLKNPMLLLTIWKVMAISAAAPALLVLLIELGDGLSAAMLGGVKVFGITFGIMFAGGILAYLILAGMYGWKYIVLFEMNEDGVVHAQQPKQFKKAEAMGWLTALAGAASGSLSATGAGLLAASKSVSKSEFRIVRKVRGVRGLHTIKVNQLMERNQVYVFPEDYDFVWNYITSRCTNAKKIR